MYEHKGRRSLEELYAFATGGWKEVSGKVRSPCREICSLWEEMSLVAPYFSQLWRQMLSNLPAANPAGDVLVRLGKGRGAVDDSAAA